MNQPIRSSLVALAVAGLGSALPTAIVPLKADVGEFSIGFVFGVALAFYFVVWERLSNLATIALFICVCTAAFPAAEYAAMKLETLFPVNGSMGSARLDIPMPVFFGAGCVGAFLVLAAGLFVYGPRTINWKSLGMVLLWSIGGGFLGVLGGGADGILTHGTYNKMLLLFLIWQPGAAVLLGLLLNRERKVLAPSSASVSIADGAPRAQVNRSILVVGGLFFACILGYLGFLIFRTIHSARVASDRAAAYKRAAAEAPSAVNLPRIEPLTTAQAFILREIAGRYPWAPMSIPSFGEWPPFINYLVGYTATKEPPPATSVQRIVAVGVTQLPNAEWARYRVKYPQPNIAIDSPLSLTKVTKFGQTLVQNTYMRYSDGRGTLCFLWPSGNFVVSVCYETPQVDEEFVKQYLEKYPSSL